MMKKILLIGFLLGGMGFEGWGQFTLPAGTSYTQNFDGIGSGLPTGWTVRTGATSTSRGSSASFATATNTWGDAGGAFKNLASNDVLTSSASTTAQNAETDRSLGIRQSGSFGDPGAAFELAIANTTGRESFSLTMKHQMLSVQPRSTTWTVQYSTNGGTVWTLLGTYADPGVFGSTTATYPFGSAIDDLSGNVLIRVSALTASSGSGSRDSYGIDDFELTWINISAATPNIAISSPALPNASTIANANNVVLQRINLAVTDADATLNGLTITTSGTYTTSDLSNLRVRFSTDSILSASDDTLSTKTSAMGPGTQVFPTFTPRIITAGTTRYLFITADISSSATFGDTIRVNTLPLDSIKFVSGIKSGSVPIGPIISLVNISGSSDIVSAGGVPSGISSLANDALITTATQGVQVWQFTVRDGGATTDADALPTILQTLTVNQGSGNAMNNWADALQSCALFENSTLVNNTPTITADQIQFTGLSFSVPDSAQRTLSLRVSLKANVNTTCCPGNGNLDGDDFQFQISNGNVTAPTDGSSSLFGSFSAISTPNDSIVYQVSATELRFTTHPPASIFLDENFSVIVKATDAGGNPDRDFADSITLSNPKLISNPRVVNPSNGESTFSNVTFNGLGTGEVLIANATGVSADTSIAFNILSTGWEFTTVGSPQLIDFSATVNNVNNGAFTGSGFSPSPTAGRLSSRAWAVSGFDGGTLSFNGTQTSGDFARGNSSGGVSTGGIYNFDVGSGARTLGIQPSGSAFTPGSITLRCLNNTGNTITRLTTAYKVFVRNDQERSNSFNFSYSLDGVNFISILNLDLITPEASTGSAWIANNRSTFIDNVSIPQGTFFYFRWDSDDVGGSGSRDELALDSISVTLNPGLTTYFYNGTGALDQLTSWGVNPDGTGANPPNFSNDFQNFIIANGSGTINLSTNLNISGLGSKLVLRDRDLTVDTNTISGRLDIEDGRLVVFSNNTMPNIGFIGNNTTVTIDGPKVNANFLLDSLGQNIIYDNLIIQNCTVPALPVARTQPIRGNLTIDASSQMSLPNLTLRFLGSDTSTIIGDIDSLRSISIDAGKVLKLDTIDLSLDATFTNNGVVILESGGSITQGSSLINAGTGTYLIRRQGFAGPQYNFMGSPVNNSSASVLGNQNFRFRYTETQPLGNSRWIQVPNASTLVNGQGYTSWNSGLVTFSGRINNGTITVSNITHTVISGDSVLDRGWNLLANPYPSAISANSFVSVNANVDGTIYLWVHEPSTVTGGNEDYLIWNSLGPVTPPSHTGSLTFDGNIASGQGFFVRKTNPGSDSIRFTNAMRVRGKNNEFFRPAQFQGIKIKLAAFDTGVYNETLVAFIPDATDSFDRLYDGLKLQGNDRISLYSQMGGLPYAIQAMAPVAQQPKIVPLGINLSQNRALRWKAVEITGLDPGFMAFLVDSLTLQSYLITDTASVWTSAIPAGTHNQRFYLVLQPPVVAGSLAQDDDSNIRRLVTRADRGLLYGKVYGNLKSGSNARILLRDMQGRILIEKETSIQDFGEFQITLPQFASGLYFVQYIDVDGLLTTRCFIKTN